MRQRRLLSLLIAPLAVLLLIAGMLSLTMARSLPGHLIGAVVALFALILLGIAQGIRRSVKLDERAAAERQLDEAILATSPACASDCGSGLCGVDDCAIKARPGI